MAALSRDLNVFQMLSINYAERKNAYIYIYYSLFAHESNFIIILRRDICGRARSDEIPKLFNMRLGRWFKKHKAYTVRFRRYSDLIL